MDNSETVYYLYGLTSGAPGTKVSVIGVDGRRPVTVRACGEIGAIVSEVDRSEFCGDAAEACLGDLAWLGPRVCRHEAAIEEVMGQTPVLPACFATLFTSIDRVQQYVSEHRRSIAGFFSQLGDKQEWAVKGLLNRTDSPKKPSSPDRPVAEEPTMVTSPGARYFREMRIKAQWERDFNSRLREFCRSAAAALAAHAGSYRERKVLAPVEAGTDAEMVLNWAFLLSPATLDAFQGCLERLNGGEAFPGLTLTLTGPWPPYSFVPDLSVGTRA